MKRPAVAAARAALYAVLGRQRVAHWALRLLPDWPHFAAGADDLHDRHWRQTRETVAALKRRYEEPVFGRERVWDLVQRLALCVDPSDTALGGVSQLVHTRQVVAGMERDGVSDPDLFFAAILHDLGKVLLLTAEAPENVVGMNAPIGEHPEGVGLDNVIFQWNHDEFAYSRLVGHVPDHVAWLVRYHSIVIPLARPCMDARDRLYFERYLVPFRRYDMGTKSVHAIPPATILDKYRDLVEGMLPGTLVV